MIQEIWLDSPVFPERYEVSNMGNVRAKSRVCKTYFKRKSKKEAETYSNPAFPLRVLKPEIMKKGYLRIELHNDDSQETKIMVHRLVAMAFIPNLNNLPQVNHIYGIKSDNRADNLEWCSNQDNIIHAFKTGLINKERNKGISAYNALKLQSLLTGEILCLSGAAKFLRMDRNLLKQQINNQENWIPFIQI